MVIQKGDFIKLNYTGKVKEGKIFDTTDEELAKQEEIFTPTGLYGGDIVIVGAGHTIEGLDEDMQGKEAGYTGNVEIPPEKAFGLSNPKLLENISLTKFKDRRVHPGMSVEVNGRRGLVTRVIGRRATVDFNSPLAGQTVTYEYTIEKVLDEDIEKVQGLLALYTGIKGMEVEIEDGIVKINIPTKLTFSQQWIIAKNRVASELFKYAGFKEVQFIEKMTPTPETPVPAETEEEAEEKAEEKVETEEKAEEKTEN